MYRKKRKHRHEDELARGQVTRSKAGSREKGSPRPDSLTLQQAKSDPASLTKQEVLQLQPLVGNQVVGKLLGGETAAGASSEVIQRIPLPTGVLPETPAGKIIDSMKANTIEELKTAFHEYAVSHWSFLKFHAQRDSTPLLQGTGIIGDCHTFANAFVQLARLLGHTAEMKEAFAGPYAIWLMQSGMVSFDGQAGDFKGQWIFDSHAWAVVDGVPYDPVFNDDTGDPQPEIQDTFREIGEGKYQSDKDKNKLLISDIQLGPIKPDLLQKLQEFVSQNPSPSSPAIEAAKQTAIQMIKSNSQVENKWRESTPEEEGKGEKAPEQPKREKEGCFLTTACMAVHGLPDDCEELTLLRHFRDTYLLNKTNGAALIKRYYRYSPAIVKKIEEDPRKMDIYEEIYQVVRDCVEAIKRQELEYTCLKYSEMFIKLKEQFIPEEHIPNGEISP